MDLIDVFVIKDGLGRRVIFLFVMDAVSQMHYCVPLMDNVSPQIYVLVMRIGQDPIVNSRCVMELQQLTPLFVVVVEYAGLQIRVVAMLDGEAQIVKLNYVTVFLHPIHRFVVVVVLVLLLMFVRAAAHLLRGVVPVANCQNVMEFLQMIHPEFVLVVVIVYPPMFVHLVHSAGRDHDVNSLSVKDSLPTQHLPAVVEDLVFLLMFVPAQQAGQDCDVNYQSVMD